VPDHQNAARKGGIFTLTATLTRHDAVTHMGRSNAANFRRSAPD
jgi:hypothetical protein